MREFMSQQPAALASVRSITSLIEHNISADRVRGSVNRLCRLRSLLVHMDPHTAQLLAKTRLEKSAGRHIQRLRGRTQHLADHTRRHLLRHFRRGRRPLPLPTVLARR